jgi:hypothetical protein
MSSAIAEPRPPAWSSTTARYWLSAIDTAADRREQVLPRPLVLPATSVDGMQARRVISSLAVAATTAALLAGCGRSPGPRPECRTSSAAVASSSAHDVLVPGQSSSASLRALTEATAQSHGRQRRGVRCSVSMWLSHKSRASGPRQAAMGRRCSERPKPGPKWDGRSITARISASPPTAQKPCAFLGTYATASHRCRSEVGADRAPAEDWPSSHAGASSGSGEDACFLAGAVLLAVAAGRRRAVVV